MGVGGEGREEPARPKPTCGGGRVVGFRFRTPAKDLLSSQPLTISPLPLRAHTDEDRRTPWTEGSLQELLQGIHSKG